MSVVPLQIPRLPVAIWLPFPPSANRMWRAVGGRNILSAPYRNWKLAAGLHLNTQFKRPVKGRYVMSLLADRPDRRGRDIDNLVKPVSDLLKAHGIIEDDSLADRIVLAWSKKPPAKGAKVWLTIEEAEE